jgi:uncharacterized protein YjbJ (UPF0337 family)
MYKDEHTRNLGTQGSKNVLSGTFKEWGGKIEAKMGQMTHSERLQAKGQKLQAKGGQQARRGRVQRLTDEPRES